MSLILIGLLVFSVAVASYALARLSARLAPRVGAVDEPTGGRKIHTKPIPLLGGMGVAMILIAITVIGSLAGWFDPNDINGAQLFGFAFGVLLIIVTGMLDDCYDLPAAVRFSVYALACLTVLMTGTSIVAITSSSGGAYSLIWNTFNLGALRLDWPADILTLAWLLVVTFATKFMDGLDGLVTGQTIIGTVLIATLTASVAYSQPSVMLLALIVGAAFLGFLPQNLHPARQFLGETGSALAGFALGFLAIVSGAKIAISLSVLAIPVADAAYVIVGRLRRGASPFKGDDTHLHFRLLKAGLSQRSVVALYWGVSFIAGIAALTLQTRGKIFLIVALVTFTLFASWIAGRTTSRNQEYGKWKMED